MRPGSRSSRGFTLIEVLVAFLILAFSLGALLNLFGGSLRSVRLGEEYAQATALARARLALIDADGIVGSGMEAGETGEGYRWSVESAPVQDAMRSGQGDFEPMAVNVTVSWGAVNSRSVTLSTIRLARR